MSVLFIPIWFIVWFVILYFICWLFLGISEFLSKNIRAGKNSGYRKLNFVSPYRHEETCGVWTLQGVQSLEWRRFEELCQWYLETKGNRTERPKRQPGRGADGGIDLICNHPSHGPMLVQCKAWGNPAGVKEVREFFGAMSVDRIHGVFFSTSGFTRDAAAFCKQQDIGMVTGIDLVERISELEKESRDDIWRKTFSGDYTTPTCPNCEIKMYYKKWKNGFWGCRNYPKCKSRIYIRKS